MDSTKQKSDTDYGFQLVHYPTVTQTPCLLVEKHGTDGFSHIAENVSNMIQFIKDHGGFGLAAPQIGDYRRYFVVNFGNKPLTMINPYVILLPGPRRKMVEGCYSLPGKQYVVKRATKVRVEYTDLLGNAQSAIVNGTFAQILQHEFDHLESKCLCQTGKEFHG